jgi:hypothetical protein
MQNYRRLIPGVLFLVTSFIYLSTLTQVHTFDALSYVLSVERKPWTEVFHPHHLAYGPLGALALALAQALGFTGGAAIPMQIVNALTGAVGVGLLSQSIFTLTKRWDLALLSGMLLASSYAYWYYAVEIEVYTVAALLLIVCLQLISQPGTPTRQRMIWLGLAQGGAILFHQTNLLLSGPILLWWWLLHQRRPSWQAFFDLCWYGFVLAFSVGAPYLWVALGVSGFRSADAILAWLTEYARTGWWGGPITWEKLQKLGQGLANTIADGNDNADGWGAAIGLGLLMIAAIAWRSQRHPTTQRTALQAACLAWLLIYGAFFFWWEPDNIEFWIASLPPVLLLFAMLLERTAPWGWLSGSVLVLALINGRVNYAAITKRGDATTDLQRQIARALAERSTPADLLVIPDGLQELYLPYYEQREQFISINQAIFDANGDWAGACATIQQRIEIARHAGATALIAADALQPPAEVLERHRLSQDAIDSCFARYRSELQPLGLLPPLPAYAVLPTAEQLARGSGWQFEQSQLGWQAFNIEQSQITATGWRFIPLSDPNLLSPLLAIETQAWQGIELVIANESQARDAQIFLIGEDGQTNERRSERWELRPGAEAQRYTLDLRENPGWQGIVTRLRIDPVGVGDGGSLRLIAIRLIPR